MCETYRNTDDPRYGCDCHLPHADDCECDDCEEFDDDDRDGPYDTIEEYESAFDYDLD